MVFNLKRIQKLYKSKKQIVAEKKKKDTNYMLSMGDMKAKDAYDNENLNIKYSIISTHDAIAFYNKAFEMFRLKSDLTQIEVVKKKIKELELFLKRFTQDELDSALIFSDADILRNISKTKYLEARYIRNIDRIGSIMLCFDAIEDFKNALELYSSYESDKNNLGNIKHVKSHIKEVETFLERFSAEELKTVKEKIDALKPVIEDDTSKSSL
ncbi:MAG: hypothetical protein K0B02_03890 [DPANN group archaeon]|nr:hypothetical protein [DPANN group archaeon]